MAKYIVRTMRNGKEIEKTVEAANKKELIKKCLYGGEVTISGRTSAVRAFANGKVGNRFGIQCY